MRAFSVLTFALIAIFDRTLANRKAHERGSVEGSRNLVKKRSVLDLQAAPPKLHQYPFLVSIEMLDEVHHIWIHHCGGTIISTGAILTSQNCAFTCSENHCRIVAGAHDRPTLLESESSLATYNVSCTVDHPDYDRSSLNYDFGVLYTNISMHLIPGKSEILELANNTCDILLENCVSPGWGHQGRLQHVKVTMLPRETCASIHGKSFKDRMICGFDPHMRFQLKELGGPLLCNGTLAGLGSWADPPSGSCKNYPAVFSDVAKELSWIKSKINGPCSKTTTL